jgi:hypothetical protein
VQRAYPVLPRNTIGHTLRMLSFRDQYLGHRGDLIPGLRRLITIFREEGPAALYKGFVPKVLRLAPGGGVLLLVVEFTLGVFRKGTICLYKVYNQLTLMLSTPSAGSAIYLI